ncbi:MAG: hypothetical protein GY856_12585 [bacterium]|nr:hypothetical protein [bacterium]
MNQAILGEFTHEAAITRKMLELVPEERFDWQPHDKSFTLVQLAGHTARVPEWAGVVVGQDELDLGSEFTPPEAPKTRAELLDLFDRSADVFKEALQDCGDDHLQGSWKLRRGDEVFLDLPRVAALRSFVLNHVVHHRGQLSVYLRLLDVPLPQVYGSTADATWED